MQRDWDNALAKYELALASDPADTNYQMLTRRVRFQAGQFHVNQGLKLRADGKLDEGLAELNKAATLDPSSTVAEQEIRRTLGMVEREKLRVRQGIADTPEQRGLTPAQQVHKESEQRESDIASAPQLKSIGTSRSTC